MDQFILHHSDAIRTLSKFIIPLGVGLIVVIIIIVYVVNRQKANKPLPSSSRKSRFASAYSGRNAAVSNEPMRRPAAAVSASNATRRQPAPEPGMSHPAYSAGIVRQRAAAVPREQANLSVTSDTEGVLEFCFAYMEDYRI